jgi:hypothetical protein
VLLDRRGVVQAIQRVEFEVIVGAVAGGIANAGILYQAYAAAGSGEFGWNEGAYTGLICR